MEVAMFKINTKLISEGSYDDQQMKTLELFKDSLNTSSLFLKFQKKRKDARNQQEVKKVTKLMNTIEGRIDFLQKEIKKRPSFKVMISERIESAQSTLNNPSSLSELTILENELFQFIKDFEDEKKIDSKIRFELITLDQSTNKLKLYLAEKMASLTPEFMISIVEKINALENIKEKTYSSKKLQLDALVKINKETSSFISKSNIVTNEDILAAKKAEKKREEDKKKAKELERKKIADAKKAEERKRKEEANAGKHFFANMVCTEAKNSPPVLASDEISFYATLGIDPDNLRYINRIYPTKLCDCVQTKTNQRISLSRRKEVNRLYKINPKTPNLVNDQEADFFASLTVQCSRELENKMEYWMKGGRP